MIAVFMAALLTFALCYLVVARRAPNGGPGWLALSPDTNQYAKIVRGVPAKPPFSYRQLVPRLASLLPLAPIPALGAVTDVSMVAGYGVLSWILIALLRVRRGAAGLALIATMASTRNLLIIQNPYIIDGFSFLIMTILLATFLAEETGWFTLAAVVGILAREDSVFSVLGFVAGGGRRRLKVAALVATVAAGAYALPRWAYGPPSLGFLGLKQLAHPSYYAKAYFAFGFLWPVMLGGLWLAPERRLVPYSVFALFGSFVSTFFAVDTTRMFLPMLPLAAVGCAMAFDRMADRPGILGAWLAIALTNVGLALPTVFCPGMIERMRELEDWYVRLAIPIVLQQVCGLGLVGLCAHAILATRRSSSHLTGD